MNTIKGIAWALFFLLAIIIGDNEVLLNLIPAWLLMVLFCAPWLWIARMAARARC